MEEGGEGIAEEEEVGGVVDFDLALFLLLALVLALVLVLSADSPFSFYLPRSATTPTLLPRTPLPPATDPTQPPSDLAPL